MIVNWRDEALADLGRIVARIWDENPIAARRLARDLILAADSLADFPRRARAGRIAGTRELVIIRPYVVVFEIGGDTVTILCIWHAAQDRP